MVADARLMGFLRHKNNNGMRAVPQPGPEGRGRPSWLRYLSACAASLLVTGTIVFLMTRLITPIGGDPVVEELLIELSLPRTLPPVVPREVEIFELPPRPEQLPEVPQSVGAPTDLSQSTDDPDDDEEEVRRFTDWQAVARSVARDLGDEGFGQSSGQTNGRPWTSVMQGSMPQSTTPTPMADEESAAPAYRTVYRNAFGDVEVKIREDCVMQMHSSPFDQSSFAQALPAKVTCKGSPNTRLRGLEDFVNGKNR